MSFAFLALSVRKLLKINMLVVEAAGVEPKSASKTKGLFDSKRDRVQEMQRVTGL
jgi:hypothetical protein